jgi:hypothetical protein
LRFWGQHQKDTAMPPIAEQLTRAVTELRNLREVLDQLKDRQSSDHDEQIRMKKDIESSLEKISLLENNQQDLSLKTENYLKEMQDEFVSTIKEQADIITRPLAEKINELKEVNKEKRSKKWEIAVIFIAAFITAVSAIIVARAFGSFSESEPKTKASSSIHSSADYATNEGRLLWTSK